MNFYRVDSKDIIDCRGVVQYLHDGEDIGSGAFDLNESSEFRVLLPRRAGVVSVFAEIYNESQDRLLMKCYGALEDFGNTTDAFRIPIDVKELGVGLYFVRFVVECSAGTLYGYYDRGYLAPTALKGFGKPYQMSVYSFESEQAKEYLGGVIYHIFVDRFAKGGDVPVRRDAVMLDGWDGGIPEYPEYPGAHLENNTFFGGTLYGVIDKLDYIKSLGTNLIYLSPVFEAYSNHKYDTANYMKVDEMFGGDEALASLIAAAKERGIGIILDGVFNHTGADSIYFNRFNKYDTLGAYQSEKSEYYSWYDFQSFPDKYTSWWGIKILPRIHPDREECGNYIAGQGGVIEKYAKLGIAGFRLDVADELSDDFLQKIKSRLNASLKTNLLYGEVWEDGSNKIAYDKRKRYYLGSELDGVMNYPYRVGIISYLRDREIAPLEYALTEVTFNAPKRVRDMQMNLLGTHDTERLITTLAGKSPAGKSNRELSTTYLTPQERKRGVLLVKMAYTALSTLPGIPAIFYGDEVGLEGYHDPFNRRPFPWNNMDAELLSHYRRMGEIRRTHALYRDADFKLIELTQDRLVFMRSGADERHMTVLNNSDRPLCVEFYYRERELIEGKEARKHTVMPYSSAVFSVSESQYYEIN